MSRYHSYINTAVRILNDYDPNEPFAVWLKKFFSASKKYGSKDRKQIAHLCYCYFRLGKALQQTPTEVRILIALYLCSDSDNPVLEALRPDLNKAVGSPLKVKIATLTDFTISPIDIFPWIDQLSALDDPEGFIFSHFVQPDLFLRAREEYSEIIEQQLIENNIPYEKNQSSFTLSNAINIDTIVQINKEAVIQDISSQRIGELLEVVKKEIDFPQLAVWDCCAASGGKSILAYDVFDNIDLTVSDIRESIIINLEKRFALAGITKYNRLVADLTKQSGELFSSQFDLIIADVPCSGSGTWGRTPEQLFHFNEEKINIYSSLQKKITANVVQYLKAGGYLLYITCSVFKRENEENVENLLNNFPLTLVKMQMIEGYEEKADSMFAALLKLNEPDQL